jgi:hypothetical protein
LQFKLLDIGLRHQQKPQQRRVITFRNKLPDLFCRSQKEQNVVRSDSLKYKNGNESNAERELRKIKGRQREYNQIIENICMKMDEPGFESEILSPDVSVKI